MKVVFLDVDGVVAPHGRPNPDVWCAETCGRLKRLLDATGAVVVLVSSWPEDAARDMLAVHNMLIHEAIAERDRRGGLGRYGLLAREAGIVDYLERHKPSAWVWLDDWGKLQGDVLPGQEHLPRRERVRAPHPLAAGYVECDWYYDNGEMWGDGLNELRLERAMTILGA